MNFPTELKYANNDEWINPEGTVGISDFAQDQLSDVVYVEFAIEVGDTIHQGDTIGTVESVKAAADVYAPISGTVTAVNDGLADEPELINSDPYGAAWLIKIDASNAGELSGLMDSTAYEKYCSERG